MPNGINVVRQDADFLYPKPTIDQRLSAWITRAAAVEYDEGMDESQYQYSATKRVYHTPAKVGGVTFTVIRVSNCITADPYFEPAWQDAAAADLPVLVYANVQGYKSGVEQADFAMRTAEPFIRVCKTKVIILGDFELDGLSMSIAARQRLALDFLDRIHQHYETGIYSNLKYWLEMYGNLKPPEYAWLWGAHWTPYTPSFPLSWNLDKLIAHQYGVWNSHYWALSVLGNVPRIDKNKWRWAGGDVNAFLKLPEPVPPEPPTNCEIRLDAVEEVNRVQDNRLATLEGMLAGLKGK